MAPREQQFDFDFIVIGSGFGGSVSALRLVEKGYRVAVMEMGRRWTAENLPRTSWSLHRWFWRPKLGLRGFFNMRFFRHVDHLPRLRRGRRVDHLCLHTASASRQGLGNGYVGGPRDWKAEMPDHYRTASRMLGVAENRFWGRLIVC